MRNTILIFFLAGSCSTLFSQSILDTLKTGFTKYIVSTSRCTKLTHFTGAQIYIPEDAFQLDEGNKVDSVDVYFREIRTPLDILVNSVPMVVNIAGKAYFLESNGMFEIWAKSAEDTIDVHEDKSIIVRLSMQPEEVDVRMEGFKFNHQQNHWESYTNRLEHSTVTTNDDDLWGGSPVVTDDFEEELSDEIIREDSIRKVAFQEMKIYDFGFYNYDKIIDEEIFVPMTANFVDQNNEALNSTIYVVYEGINSVFYYPPYTWGENFSIIKGRSYTMFTFSKEGILLKLPIYPSLNEITTHTFVLVAEKEAVKDKIELARTLGIQ